MWICLFTLMRASFTDSSKFKLSHLSKQQKTCRNVFIYIIEIEFQISSAILYLSLSVPTSLDILIPLKYQPHEGKMKQQQRTMFVWGSAYVEGLFQRKHFIMEGLEGKTWMNKLILIRSCGVMESGNLEQGLGLGVFAMCEGCFLDHGRPQRDWKQGWYRLLRGCAGLYNIPSAVQLSCDADCNSNYCRGKM